MANWYSRGKDQSTLGSILLCERHRIGFSLLELSQRTMISEGYLDCFEKNSRIPNRKQLHNIIRVLSVDIFTKHALFDHRDRALRERQKGNKNVRKMETT